MLQSHWDASDEVGRIKVIISEGYGEIKEDKAGFVKLTDHVVFNFQAAPLGQSNNHLSISSFHIIDIS